MQSKTALTLMTAVLFGGLGGVNQVTYNNYFLPTYNFITANNSDSPFDIFALHPYYYEDNQGRLMVNPQEYLHYDWTFGTRVPTAIHLFGNFKPCLVSERI
ncbi:MAG: hypothetical protein R2911_20840 [Caldilineaceae bacterium]